MTPPQVPRPLPLFLDLVREVAADDPELARRAMEGLRRYQAAERQAYTRPARVVAQQGRVRLIDYGTPSGDDLTPVIFVPSVINPPIILDLAEGNSLLRFIAAHGFRPLLLDWGEPGPTEADETLGDHVSQYLVPLVETIAERGCSPHIVGYCIGGTMALAAAHLGPVASLAMIASPWHFDHYGEDRAMLAGLWSDNAAMCRRLGLVPMELLQVAFWRMDPERTVRKYARVADADTATLAQFTVLEDWANEGAPLTWAAGRELMEDLFAANVTGSARWKVEGEVITPETVPCPARQFVSSSDRIVPAASCAAAIPQISAHSGHVGMVVGSSARTALWEPLANWLSQVQHNS